MVPCCKESQEHGTIFLGTPGRRVGCIIPLDSKTKEMFAKQQCYITVYPATDNKKTTSKLILQNWS